MRVFEKILAIVAISVTSLFRWFNGYLNWTKGDETAYIVEMDSDTEDDELKRCWRKVKDNEDFSALAGREERFSLKNLGINLWLSNGRPIAVNNGVDQKGFLQTKALEKLGVIKYIELWGSNGKVASVARTRIASASHHLLHGNNNSFDLVAAAKNLAQAGYYRRLDIGKSLLKPHMKTLKRAVSFVLHRLLVRPDDVVIAPKPNYCYERGLSAAAAAAVAAPAAPAIAAVEADSGATTGTDTLAMCIRVRVRGGGEQRRLLERCVDSPCFANELAAALTNDPAAAPLLHAIRPAASAASAASAVGVADEVVRDFNLICISGPGPVALRATLTSKDQKWCDAHVQQLEAVLQAAAAVEAAATEASALLSSGAAASRRSEGVGPALPPAI